MINVEILNSKKIFVGKDKTFFDYDFILQNSEVKLRTLNKDDITNLQCFVLETDIWTYFAQNMSSNQDLTYYINDALYQRNLELRYTFIIENISINKIIGSTAFGNYSKNDQRIEIGWSWLGKEFQGTKANKNTKFLLLTFAFEYLNIERVEFKTDVLNQRARNALLKIGATEEGILRSHGLMPGNRRRDTIYYSILKGEWPNIRSSFFSKYSDLSILNFQLIEKH